MAARLKPASLAAIMVIVPTCFWLGSSLNDRTSASSPSTTYPSSFPLAATPAVPTIISNAQLREQPQARRTSVEDEIAMLQSRMKNLKSTKFHLENDLKDNEDKLRRINLRIERQAQKQAVST